MDELILLSVTRRELEIVLEALRPVEREYSRDSWHRTPTVRAIDAKALIEKLERAVQPRQVA